MGFHPIKTYAYAYLEGVCWELADGQTKGEDFQATEGSGDRELGMRESQGHLVDEQEERK